MSTLEKNEDPFLDALRQDLPTARDEARSRARLIAAGALVATSAVAPGLAAGSASAAQVGLWTKIAAWPAAAKVGVATSLVLATAVPVAWEATNSGLEATAPSISAPQPAPGRSDSSRITRSFGLETLEGAEPRPAPSATPPRTPSGPDRRSEPARASNSPRATSTDLPGATPRTAVAAFPSVTTTLDDGSLAEEARLIERGLAANRAGDRAEAARWLLEHQRRFPDGLLSRERERALTRLRQSSGSTEVDRPGD